MSAIRLPRLGRYVFFVLAALSLMMFSIDGTIVAVAIPTMTRELHTNLALIGWTLTGYQLTQTVVLPLAGKLADNFGRFRVFLVCVFLFTLGSLLCGVAPNIYYLIVFRVLQALGGGGVLPSATGIIAQEFPDKRARMIGLFASIFPIGGVIGPNLGGFIIEHASWREVFLVNVPLGVIVLAMLARRVRQPERTVRAPIDVAGAALFAGAILCMLTALTLLGEDPSYWRTPPFWALLGAGALSLVAFVWQERRAADPILDPSVVLRRPFPAVNAYNFLFGASVFGFFSFIPYYATVQYGMTPAQSGAILTPRSLVMMATAAFASFLLLRFGYRLPMMGGMLLVASSLLLLSRGWTSLTIAGVELGPFVVLAIEVALAGLGMGLAAPASNNAALDLWPERAALITGIRGMFRSTGGVLGTALIVLWLEASPDKAAGMRTIFVVLAAVLLTTLPLALLIPDSARQRRVALRQAAVAGE
jgi:EmrB/QacA subfamily drug resistance transporter